jgi:tetratricopeptide (TPR) repeat protein
LAFVLARGAAASGFLSSGPGARAAAMGGAFTGLADDSSAMFYNPAGLAGQRGTLMFEHVPINESGSGFAFNDGRLDFLSLIFPSRYGTFGFGLHQFAIGGIETRATLADAATIVKVSQTAYFFPYAMDYKGWSLGVTGKAVNYSLAGYGATGLGADIGAKRLISLGDTRLGRDTQLSFGAAVRNAIAPTFTLYQDPTALERTTAFGVALSAYVREHYEAAADHVSHDRLSLSIDATKGNQDSGFGLAFGVDYAYLDRYAVRLGFNGDGNLTFGLGLGGRSSKFRVDYASVLAPLAPQHRFTVSWLFTDPATSVESDVHLSAYRRAILDQERLRDRFLHDGRSAVAEGDYDDALTAFQKAQALDPHASPIGALVQSAQEGSRLAGVKDLLDASRRERAAGHDELAAKDALLALEFDPDSRDAAEFAVQLRNGMIAQHGPAAYDYVRAQLVDILTRDFGAALAARNPYAMRVALARVKALAPDNTAAWQPLADKLAGTSTDWLLENLREADRAHTAGDPIAMSRAVRRVRRLDPNHKQLGLLAGRLRPLSRKTGSSFYDTNYLRQLYYAAASEYVVGDYESSVQNLNVLLRANATHEDGNALIDRMRAEGHLSEENEP